MAAGDLHVIGASDGKLWHTVRFDTSGGPWQPFFDVKRKAGEKAGDFVDVDCAREAGSPGDAQGILHVVGVTGDGQLRYTVRESGSDHRWKPFPEKPLNPEGRGPFLRAAITAARQANRVEVVVAGVTAAGRLWVTTRKSATEFDEFTQIAASAGGDPAFRAVALAAVPGQQVKTHLAAVSSDGHLWHTVGQPGQWPSLQDVEAPAAAGNKPGDLTDVACSDNLDLGAASGDGHVWYATRNTDTSWEKFNDPETNPQVPGADRHVGAFLRIGVARLQSVLHLCGVTADGRLWHALSPGPGAVFRDVKNVIDPPPEVGSFQAVSCA
jgi:hypothetical protein